MTLAPEILVFYETSSSCCADWLPSLRLQLFLGMYPDEHFIEKPVKAAMERFRRKLVEISASIKRRNEGKKLPYYNMSPDKIPNSVAV